MNTSRQFWLLLAAVVLFGRIFQTQVLWAEESLPLAAAQQILAGQTLYKDIWFDKPPLLAWFYAGVLRIAGYSGWGLRLVGSLYVFAAVVVSYALARRLWGEPAGRWAAFFLAFFTAFYVPSATVALAADLLLVLPHLAVLYFVVARRWWLAGVCAGVGFHLNSKALMILAVAMAWVWWTGPRRKILPLAGGFAAAAVLGLAWIAAGGAWAAYREQVWEWGSMYARAPFGEDPWRLGIERTVNYLGFHAALVLGAVFFFRRSDDRVPMAIWIAAGFVAAAAGARFFPRYYFQVLPPLALAAGAGWSSVKNRRIWIPVLLVALAVPAVRFGKPNLLLALGRSFEWRDTGMDADSRRIALAVAGQTPLGAKIFVWGFRPEIYYYARRTGASRFLESQPLTGVLADRHLARSEPFLDPGQSARYRAELGREFAERPPAAIVDGLGPFNPRLAMSAYPEFSGILQRYRLAESTSGARLYLPR